MAGDERTGVCVMRVTAGLDSGPVALREEIAIERRGRLRHARRAAGRSSVAACSVEALERQAEGGWS